MVFFFFVTRQVLIQLSQVGALLPPVSVKGSLFISSTLSSTNPTCKFQQKGFIRSNIEVFLCIYWHFILFPNAFCFEIGTKTWSVKLYKKWNMFFHRISSKNVTHTENTNRSTFKVKVFSGSNTDKLFVARKICCITKKQSFPGLFPAKINDHTWCFFRLIDECCTDVRNIDLVDQYIDSELTSTRSTAWWPDTLGDLYIMATGSLFVCTCTH